MDLEVIISKAPELVFTYGLKLVGAIIVFVIGSWLIKLIAAAAKRVIESRSSDESLNGFAIGIVRLLLKVLLIITALSTLGVEMTSFVAILGAAGLAVGLALSGTLQNFAGGAMIILFKPFKVGDFLEAQGHMGVVSAIQVFNTIMKTPDNKTVIIPNGQLANAAMTNYSTEPQRRVDWTFGIGYGDDVDKARQVIQGLCDQDARILKEPAVLIAVSELADSSVNFAVRAWVKSEDFWPVYFAMNEQIYKTFDQEGLSIPFPQVDMNVSQQLPK